MIKTKKDFDELHKEHNSFTEKAGTKCKQLLHWLYVAAKDNSKNGIAQVKFEPCTNEDIISKMHNFEKVSLNQGQNPQAQVARALIVLLEQLAVPSKATQEALVRMTTIQEKEPAFRAEKSFSKIPASYRNMLLNSSGISKAKSSVLCHDAMEFFKLSGMKQAQIHLNSLKDSENVRVLIPHSIANILFYRAIKGMNLATLSDFSAIVLESESYLRNDSLRDSRILEAST